MQRTVNDLESQKTQLEKDVTSLKQENGLLRVCPLDWRMDVSPLMVSQEIVQLKYGWKVDSKKGEPVSDDKGKESDT